MPRRDANRPPGADGLHVALQGDLGAVVELTGNGETNEATDTPWGMPVPVVAGEGLEPPTHGL